MSSDVCSSRGADFLRRFRPCVVNYGVHFRRSTCTGNYFATPYPGYSKRWGVPPYGIAPEEQLRWGGVWYIGTEAECADRLHHDLDLLAGAGFNALRVFGLAPQVDENGIAYPIAPESEAALTPYLDLLSGLLSTIASHGLKAILLVGAGTPWHHRAVFHQFLADLCGRVGDHPALLALDLYNEPGWLYPWTPDIDKLATAHWIAESYWTIRRLAPQQLVTVGLTHPDAVAAWDPALIPLDFISYHFYAPPPVGSAMDHLAELLCWAGRTSVRPWIIGETALAGSDEVTNDPAVGTEADQKLFADFTLARSLDCGADGYSWWQYQDVDWGDASNRMGMITRLDDADPANSDRRKPVFDSFAAYPGAIRDPSNAVKPQFYGNVANHPVTVLNGKCVDESGNALADVVIRAQRQNEGALYVTFSADDGTYTVKGPASSNTLSWASASKAGYGVVDAAANPNHCVLETWRDHSWSRRWVAKVAGQIDYSSPGGFTSWTIDAADRFYVGDFDGDGRDEVLCAKTGGSAGDAMVMLRFDGQWSLVWSNNQSPAAGEGIYPYRFNMVAGDFDGDGAEELLGIGPNGDWLTLFRFANGDWRWIASTNGNVQHPLRPYASRLISGRFDGGADLLLGVASWTTLFRFDAAANDWVWVDSDYGTTNDPAHPLSALRPYAGSVVVGDFDGNGRDEILGFGGTAASSWMTLFARAAVRSSG